MMYTPSQPQYARSECQFQNIQPEMFLRQLNFPNHKKKKKKTCLQWRTSVLESPRDCAIASVSYNHLTPLKWKTYKRQQQQSC